MASLKLWQNVKQWRYTDHDPVDVDPEAAEKFLGEEDESISTEKRDQRAQRLDKLRLLTIVNVVILGVTVFLNSLPYLSNLRPHDKNADIKAVSSYSPLLNDIDVQLHDVRFNGTLWPSETPAWSRREPGPEVDELWERYEPGNLFPIRRADVVALGKDPDTAARFPDDHWHMGDDAYVASLDAFHKTHCLNELRKMTFEDYGHYKPLKHRHGKLWWIHLRHCVDMLLQDQVCHADADVLTYNWVDTQPYPFPDFSINRKCRDMEELREWRDERIVDLGRYKQMKKPEGVRQLPFEPGYYEMYGFNKSTLFPDGRGYEKYMGLDRLE
ncbi:MAG: hypothetical protein ASARMPREDX12_001465 [Alectoria sarmentosa]|nr:MAG: hypothetical protein ASARMPREDX12_001465 [Alectoria sarmentosa]